MNSRRSGVTRRESQVVQHLFAHCNFSCFLPFQEMRELLNGDRVAVRVVGSSRGKPAGSVVEILERGKQMAVGSYRREHGVGYVVEAGRSPHHFVVPNHQTGGARSGDMVKLEITEYPSRHREAQGKVVKVLGDKGELEVLEMTLECLGLGGSGRFCCIHGGSRFVQPRAVRSRS